MYQQTPKLLNAEALALLHLKRYREADTLLTKAMRMVRLASFLHDVI